MAEDSSSADSKNIDENGSEISLEGLDQLLEKDDPEFAQSLSEIQGEGPVEDVEIESLLTDDESLSSDEFDERSRWQKVVDRWPWLERLLKPLVILTFPFRKMFAPLRKFKPWLMRRWWIWRSRFITWFRQSMVFVKTQPKEFAAYAGSQAKAVIAFLKHSVVRFKQLSLAKKLAIFGFLSLCALTATVLAWNLKGEWLPRFHQPLLTQYLEVADQVYNYDPESESILFLEAFPQPQFEVLFKKVVVNLRRENSRSNPMGAFEFFVNLDSKDTAIEVKQREKELLDLVSRTVEGLSYNEINGARGQSYLKAVIKKELNSVLTQGWVRDVYIRTIILKP